MGPVIRLDGRPDAFRGYVAPDSFETLLFCVGFSVPLRGRRGREGQWEGREGKR